MDEIAITHVPDRHRYEAQADGHVVGTSDYVITDGVISFTHAEVEPAYGGRGIASELARFSLEDVRRTGGLRVRPVCSFYSWYLERHAEYDDLVA